LREGECLRKYYYEEFVSDMAALADKVLSFGADGILFIARGGATMAHFLAMRLGVCNMYALNAHSYDGQTKLGSPIIKELPNIKGCKKVIIADEIVDSGETLKAVQEALKAAYPKIEFKSVALFQRENAVVRADHVIHLTDEWVEFFWERDGGEAQ
jgi:xanthine phosphoribosyltransferase